MSTTGPGSWSGRKVARLVALTLANKGTVCHLCHEPGADSADHDPPRSVLVAAGHPNPDNLTTLWPAHLLCNVTRQARPITPALRDELRGKYLASVGRSPTRATLSPRFAARRPTFSPRAEGPGSPRSSFYRSE